MTSFMLITRYSTGLAPPALRTTSFACGLSATEMQLSTANHIRDAVAATLGFASSSMPEKIKTWAIGLYEEVTP